MLISNNFVERIKDNKILISFSGGVDSSVLLYDLMLLKDKFNLDVEAFHFNHKTRDGESEKDESFVRDVCRKYGIYCHFYSESIKKYSVENKISEEEAGRILRKNAIENILSNKSDRDLWRVLLAHNRDDKVESVLMRIIRGTGVSGLVGIREEDGNIIRPLLDVSKNEILEYAKLNSIGFAQDKTNFENLYTRNSIRNELIPYIKTKYNSNIENAIIQLSNIANSYTEILEKHLEDKMKGLDINRQKEKTSFKREELLNFSEFELIEILKNEIERIKGNVYNFTFKNFEEILKIIYSKNSVNVIIRDMIFYNSFDFFVIRKHQDSDARIENAKVGKYEFNGFEISIENLENLEIRTRLEGDKIFHRGKYRKLKDYFIDKKVDKFDRDIFPVIVKSDEILAVGDIYSNCEWIQIRRKSLQDC